MTLVEPWHTFSIAVLVHRVQFTARHPGGWPIDEIMELRRRLDAGIIAESDLPPDVLAHVINPPPDPLGGGAQALRRTRRILRTLRSRRQNHALRSR